MAVSAYYRQTGHAFIGDDDTLPRAEKAFAANDGFGESYDSRHYGFPGA
jgi:hypothetical protein